MDGLGCNFPFAANIAFGIDLQKDVALVLRHKSQAPMGEKDDD